MAHEVESMFYVDQVPWHGLGTQLENPPTIEEGIRVAGLDWNVETKELFLDSGLKIPKHRAVVRDSDKSVLGIVGKNWTPLQNDKAFEFFQPFLDAGECTLETAGSLRGGRHVFILAQIKKDPIRIVGDDVFRQYLLLANGHDGSLAASVAATPIRVVCANTLAMTLEDKASKILRCVHTQKIEENLSLVQDTINLTTQQFEATAEQYKLLAKSGIRELELMEYVTKVFFPPKKSKKTVSLEVKAAEERAAQKLYEKILPLFETGRGSNLPGVRGTYWGAYNAITEHLSYSRGRSQDVRVDSLWFGAGGALNQRALKVAVEAST